MNKGELEKDFERFLTERELLKSGYKASVEELFTLALSSDNQSEVASRVLLSLFSGKQWVIDLRELCAVSNMVMMNRIARALIWECAFSSSPDKLVKDGGGILIKLSHHYSSAPWCDVEVKQ